VTGSARPRGHHDTCPATTRAVRLIGSAVLFLALSGTAGCGTEAEGSTSGGSTSGTTEETDEIDPCTLLTAAEVEKALGKPAEGAPDERITTTTNCQWQPDGPEGRNLSVSLIGLGGSGYGWSADNFHGGMKGLGEPITGIGDAAYGTARLEDFTYGPYAQLDVLHHGDRWFQLVYQPADDEKGLSVEAMSTIAFDTSKLVVDRH
jgi:hypothetical protein